MNAAVPVGIDTAPSLRAATDSVPQPWARLSAHLARVGLQFNPDPPPRQFSGGLANLNYLIVVDGHEAVLRRPPMGTLPPGAYDMGREFRILSRLSQGLALAPAGIHLGEDPAVLGAPFQIIEFRRGFAVRSELPPALLALPDIGARLGRTLIDVLLRIHAVEPQSVGLDTLGRPEGFLQRAVEGWSQRALIATEGCTSALIPELSRWLRAQRVPDGPAVLLHNDLKLDNILLHGQTLAPVAVLDWDQGTRGDALFDLATTLSYWTEAGDPPVMHELQQMPTAHPGFPTRLEAAQAYARASGRDLSDFRFYRVLAMLKLAVIFHQLHARYRQGATREPRYAGFGRLADGLLEFAQDVARGHCF